MVMRSTTRTTLTAEGTLLPNFDGVIFRADDGIGLELWYADDSGARMVFDINPAEGEGSDPQEFVTVGDWVYFSANDGVHGAELWRSNGTTTEMVADTFEGELGLTPMGLELRGPQPGLYRTRYGRC